MAGAIYLVLFGVGETPYIVGLGGATVIAAGCSHDFAGLCGRAAITRADAMDDKKPSSSWDDLIKQVGAAPAPDALERKRPAIETTFDPPPAINPAAVKPKPGDWNALADTLGIDAPAPAEPPRKASRETVRGSDFGGPSSDALEASFAEIEPIESMFEEIIEEEVSDIEFESDDDSDLDDESDLDDDDSDASDDSDADDDSELDGDDSDLADDADDDEPETLSGEAARSAFEALFQAGSFGALPPMKKPPAAREARELPQGPQWRDPDAEANEDFDERSEFDEPETGESETVEGEASTSNDEHGRPRRRRRRRGRGRGKEGAPSGDRPVGRQTPTRAEDEAEQWPEAPLGEEAGDDEGEREASPAGEGDEGEQPTRRRRVRRRRRRGGPSDAPEGAPARAASNGSPTARDRDADDEDDEEDDDMAVTESAGRGDDEDDDDDDEDLPRDSHKNIPTWAEAISVMVETNMQSRKNSPSRPSGPRERGGGRGRGRGRGGSGGGGGGRRGKP